MDETMDAIHAQLQDTIQTLHRKAIDADKILDQLQHQQKGKFVAVFAKDSGFTTEAKRFCPYIEEIAQDWQALKAANDEDAKAALPALVKKIEVALVTLQQFKTTVK
jgi:primosomal protein N''